ncbi:MAG: right-handed parallel beta-helix repeat-containing protein [Elusimicrobiota bacterium]
MDIKNSKMEPRMNTNKHEKNLVLFFLVSIFLYFHITCLWAGFTGDFSQAGGSVYDGGNADGGGGVAVDTITAGGPYIYVTGSSSNGVTANDYFTIKYDATGVMLASATFNSVYNYNDEAQSVAVSTSGDVYVIGRSSNGSNWDYVTVKYNSNLVFQSSAVFNSVYNNADEGFGIAVKNNNVYVTGNSNNGSNDDFVTVKYDSNLVFQSSVVFNGGNNDLAKKVAVDNSGNVYITGASYNASYDYAVIKYDSNLVFLSSDAYDSGNWDDSYGVAIDTSGNVFVTGLRNNGANDACITVKYNSNLTFQSSVVFDTTYDDRGQGIAVDKSGNVYVTGFLNNGSNWDYLTLKYNNNLVFQSSTGYNSGFDDNAYGIAVDTSAKVYVTGSSNNDFRTIRCTLPSSVIKSVASGNWDSTNTWEDGTIPLSSQGVEIQSGHTVTFNRNDTAVTCSTITISGTLQYDGAVDTRTMVVAGNIDIQNGGKLLMPPNTGYISALKIKCNSDGEFGIIVNNGGIFDVQGNTTTTPSTRNCLIASDNPSAKTYIRNLSQTETNFNLYYVEISSVGVNATSKFGITFDGPGTRGKINYCTVHSGYYDIYLNQSSNNTISNNSCYSSSNYGILLYSNCNNNTISNNSCYSNSAYGIYLYSSCNNNTISNNSCYSNTSYGIYLAGDSNNTISNNSCYSNSAYGILLNNNSNNNIISNNSCYSNTNYGICLNNSSNNNTISNNSCYSNQYGIDTYNSINNTVVNCELGKGGNNTNGDIYYSAGSVSKLTLKNCNLYSATKVATNGMDTAGSYLVSYNQDGTSGNVKIWGDYHIQSGNSEIWNFGNLLYVSTATQPNSTLNGTGSITYPVTVDSMTVTELWEVKCVGDPSFEVKRSSAIGASFISDGTATEGSAYTSTARGVVFTIGSDAYSVGDVFYFVTISSSNDQNVQKKIEFSDTPVGTKLTVDTGGTLQMLGTQAYPTISTSAASNYYGFYASGTINASNYTFSNLASSGVVIVPGTTVVDLSSGTFDTIQAGAGDASYIRVTGITSNATFYSCVFNDTSGTANYNVKADGSDINWTFRKWSGVKAGEDYDYDGIGSTVTWIDPLSVDITELSFNFGQVSFGGSVISDSSATITNNGDVNATYQIKLSTPPGWTAGTTAGIDQFVFYVIVSSAEPSPSDFGSEDIVSTTAQTATNTVFAGPTTENGVNVPPGEKRYMWTQFLAPTKTTTETQQGITITITPVSP